MESRDHMGGKLYLFSLCFILNFSCKNHLNMLLLVVFFPRFHNLMQLSIIFHDLPVEFYFRKVP